MTFGHTNARYFPPENGGLVFQGTANVGGVFRIDHDQAFQQTTSLRYQHGKTGPWASFIWRYDSGLVVTGVPDVAAALTLTPAQQVNIGFSCNGAAATLQQPIRSCNGIGRSTLLTLPQTGTENNDHNPDRVKPRNLFDLTVGTDNLLRGGDRNRMSLQMTVTNLTNKVALYNFLSTFSGTHFVPLRNPVTVKGVVTRVEWSNPHVYLHLGVKTDRGVTEEWTIELASPSVLHRHGWTSATIKPADTIACTGGRARSGARTMRALAIERANGKKLKA